MFNDRQNNKSKCQEINFPQANLLVVVKIKNITWP